MDQKTQEWVAAAKARGAIQIDDSQPGRGFEDDETESPLTPELAKQVEEIEDRIANRKATSSADELASAYQEENTDAVRAGRLPFQSELEQWHPGRVMHMHEFIHLLQQINPTFFLSEDSHLSMRGLGLVVAGEAIYSGVAIQDRIMPEWSQLRVDRYGVASGERKRGWRAVLLGLISRNHVTLGDCNRVFGESELSPRSRSWFRTLFCIRNGRCPECKKVLCDCKDGWDYLRADAYQYVVPEDVKQGKRQIVERCDASRIYVP